MDSNPDTKPYPNALAELVQRAATSKKGMISSTIVTDRHLELVHCRGLRWDRFLARAVSIGFRELAHGRCDIDAIEAAMDSPSGASMYVTRECAECVGPMDERFFLYFEDFDWGIRAKRFGLGYAKDSMCSIAGGQQSDHRRASRRQISAFCLSSISKSPTIRSKALSRVFATGQHYRVLLHQCFLPPVR